MSAKTTAQQGRRTPLSLSGAVTKSQPNKGSNSIANGGGNNANGQSSSNSKQQENKIQQKNDQPTGSKDSKENSNKKQQPQSDKKTLNENKKTEKNQNGVNTNKQETNEKKLQSNEKVQQQNGKDDNKSSDKFEKSEKSEKSEKIEKDTARVKEDKKGEQNIPDNKKEEKKAKETKDLKESKKDESSLKENIIESQKQMNDEEEKIRVDDKTKCVDKELEVNIAKADIVEDQTKQNSSSNPPTPKSNSKTNKASTTANKTPSKIGEVTPQKSTPTGNTKSTPVTKREVTTTIDDNDIEMEPLAIESSPVKFSKPEEAINTKIIPSATSTPGKLRSQKRNAGVPKSDVELGEISPERPRMFSQITGRKSIRQISEYSPSKFQSNSQFRESYRRIITELDTTNTSMNVTVGSEVPNNSSFSFFNRGRKRDRTPTQHSQSAIGELQTEIEVSPPKKARLDMHGLFSAVSSPLTLLRNRFSKASLQSSTPLKLQQKLTPSEDEIEVQNVSGISMHEEIAPCDDEPAETSTVIDGDDDVTLGEEIKETKLKQKNSSSSHVEEKVLPCGKDQTCEQLGTNIIGVPLQTAVGDPISKNKKCVVM